MKESTDLEIEEKVAEIEGTAVHNCLSGGRSFPSYLQWRLAGPLMVKHKVTITHGFKCSKANNTEAWGGNINRAILLAVIDGQRLKKAKR